MLDKTVDHYENFFSANSTIMRTLEDFRDSMTDFISSAAENSSLLATWNETLRETLQDTVKNL